MTARLVAGPDLGTLSARHDVDTVQSNHIPKAPSQNDATSLTAVLRFTKEES